MIPVGKGLLREKTTSFKKHLFIYLCLYLCVRACVCVDKDNLSMLVLSFHHVGGAGITGVRQQTLLPTEPIFSTHNMIFIFTFMFSHVQF